ncbi:Uncharacterised protein [uncultured archaeon]|nr:Uncharacterised protein [uncultured archaeon]
MKNEKLCRDMLADKPLNIWECKIGCADGMKLPAAADMPMRYAIREAYMKLTGDEPDFIFSGWGANLTYSERKVVFEDLT